VSSTLGDGRRRRVAVLLPVLWLALLAFSGCQLPAGAAPPATLAPTAVPPEPSPTSPPPLVVADVPTATALPSFALLPTSTATLPPPR
jgi:hypothetical protein